MAYQNHLLIRRQRSHEFRQGLVVFRHGTHFLGAFGMNSRGGHVKGANFVALRSKQRRHLVPAPRAVASSVNQHKVFLSLIHHPPLHRFNAIEVQKVVLHAFAGSAVDGETIGTAGIQANLGASSRPNP
nr:hypothetical protein Iba_chr11dCG12930 [Ipomoea batatas]GME01535.1 hypothetical protein Iba_contig2011CG0010 [Ipomoea batatas]GME11303.1 hypothetical protein Iba_scaffold11450CG0010 [Ipomoea batatas]